MRRLGLALFLVASGALGACSLLTDVGAFSAGGPLADAAVTGDGASSLDAGGEGGGAKTDGGNAGVGCAGYADASFCVDFEGPSPLSVPTWTESDEASSKGKITLTQSGAVSPKNAARFDLMVGGPKACNYLQLERTFTGAFDGIRARFDIHPENDGVFSAVHFAPQTNLQFSWILAVGKNLVNFFLQKYDGVDVTQIGGKAVTTVVDPLGRWSSVTFEYLTNPKRAAFTAGDTRIELPLPPEFAPTNARLVIGPYCSDHTSQASFDDVAVWLSPPP